MELFFPLQLIFSDYHSIPKEAEGGLPMQEQYVQLSELRKDIVLQYHEEANLSKPTKIKLPPTTPTKQKKKKKNKKPKPKKKKNNKTKKQKNKKTKNEKKQ